MVLVYSPLPNSEHSIPSQKEPHLYQQQCPIISSPRHQAIAVLFMFLWISLMRHHKYVAFVTGFTGEGSPMLLTPNSISRLGDIPLHGCVTLCLFAPQLMALGCLYLWPLNNDAMNTWVHAFVCTFVFISLGYIFLGVELLHHTVTLCLTLEEFPILFSKRLCHFIIPLATVRVPNPPHLTNIYHYWCLFNAVTLASMNWCLRMLLICISLMTNVDKYLFTCLLVICITLEKCLCKLIVHLEIFVFTVDLLRGLCIFWMKVP